LLVGTIRTLLPPGVAELDADVAPVPEGDLVPDVVPVPNADADPVPNAVPVPDGDLVPDVDPVPNAGAGPGRGGFTAGAGRPVICA